MRDLYLARVALAFAVFAFAISLFACFASVR
jgi:hypothetical protein